jgi:hypothetical protein
VKGSSAKALIMLALVACTTSVDGVAPTSDATPPESGAPSNPASASPSSPAARSDIQFVLRERYRAGHRIPVRIENIGDIAYEYQTIYQACFLTYRDERGREFLIPPGTHCDLLSIGLIVAGESKLLFKWDLDECTQDEWGCARARPLPPGTYRISGTFEPVDAGATPARPEASFRIKPSGDGSVDLRAHPYDIT